MRKNKEEFPTIINLILQIVLHTYVYMKKNKYSELNGIVSFKIGTHTYPSAYVRLIR